MKSGQNVYDLENIISFGASEADEIERSEN
jgi:hypothetical protein